MGFEDKRRSQRFDVQLALRVRRGDEEVTGMTQNLSLGGLLANVPLDPVLQMGERVHIAFSVPQISDPIEADAEVRWTSGDSAGLQFVTGLRAKHTWALGKFLESLANGS